MIFAATNQPETSAKQLAPGKREEFLDAFPCILPGKGGQTISVAPALTPADQLLDDFTDLRAEIEARLRTIGDGSYWDDLDEDDMEEYDYYSDASGEVLSSLKNGPERGEVAGFLIAVGGKLGEKLAVLNGYRERFRSTANERTLLRLESEADEDERLETSCVKEILCGLALVDRTTFDPAPYRRWTGNLGEGRINSILAGKHRGEYHQAATILGALTEILATDGDKKKAQNLLHEYCRVLYNRLIAFRREVRETVGKSEVLRGMADGL